MCNITTINVDLHNLSEECRAETEVPVISLPFCLLMLWDCVRSVFFFSQNSCCFPKLGSYLMKLRISVEFIFSDRASGVKEAHRAKAGPQGEMARMAMMVSLGCLVILDYRWVCYIMIVDPHFISSKPQISPCVGTLFTFLILFLMTEKYFTKSWLYVNGVALRNCLKMDCCN